MLMTPDNFPNNWYKWLTNQISHCALGFALVILYCALGAHIADSFPDKWVIWVSIAVGYALIEVIQRGPFWDSVEDFLFVVVYGAGLTLWVIEWTGGWTFSGDMSDMAPWVFYILFHLLSGVVVRLARAKSGKYDNF